MTQVEKILGNITGMNESDFGRPFNRERHKITIDQAILFAKQIAELSFDAGYEYFLQKYKQEMVGFSKEVPDKETHINNLFNHDSDN